MTRQDEASLSSWINLIIFGGTPHIDPSVARWRSCQYCRKRKLSKSKKFMYSGVCHPGDCLMIVLRDAIWLVQDLSFLNPAWSHCSSWSRAYFSLSRIMWQNSLLSFLALFLMSLLSFQYIEVRLLFLACPLHLLISAFNCFLLVIRFHVFAKGHHVFASVVWAYFGITGIWENARLQSGYSHKIDKKEWKTNKWNTHSSSRLTGVTGSSVQTQPRL